MDISITDGTQWANSDRAEDGMPRSESNMVINCVLYQDGLRVRDITIEEISDFIGRPGIFVWVGLKDPTQDLLAKVQEEFGLHDLAVEDAYRAHQRPKLEAYGDTLFVVLRPARLTEKGIEFGETHIFIGKSFVLSIRHGETTPYIELRMRCEKAPELMASGPSYVLYALMDFVVDHYFPILENLEDDFEKIEESIYKGRSDAEVIGRIYDFKSQVTELRRAVLPIVNMCNELPNHRTLIAEEVRPYFRDVADHAQRIMEVLESGRDMMTTALSVNLALSSFRQNEVVKRLAGWAALLAIPTMVGGIYGMNFDNMPELQWRYGYPMVLGVTAVIVFFVYRRLKKAGWL